MLASLVAPCAEGAPESKRPNILFLMHHYKAPHDYFEHAPRYDDWLADTEIPQPESLRLENRTPFGSIATLGHEGELMRHIGTSIGNRNPRRSYAVDLPSMFPQDIPPGYDPSAPLTQLTHPRPRRAHRSGAHRVRRSER